jgi:hypothetical protein
MLDIMIARITHVDWMYQLEMMLKKGSVAINLRSCNECDLGIWLYGDALKVYEEIPEIDLLEKSHKAFHIAADKVSKWHNNQRFNREQTAQAQADFDEAMRMSKEIVYHLTMLELKMLQRYQVCETSSSIVLKDLILHPLQTLHSRIGSKSSKQDISKTSLNLLKRDLEKKDVRIS